MTNVLFIHHGKGIGGAPISLLNLIKHLDKDKFKVKVASLKGGAHIDLFKNAGIEIEIIDAPAFYFSHNETGRKQWYYLPYYCIVFFVWLYTAFYVAPKYLKKQKYDIIHLNSHVLTSWAFAAKRLKSKVILHNREAITKGYLGIRYMILKNLIKKNCHHIINISEDNRNRLGIFCNSSVVYNFIDIPESFRETMEREGKRVLFLGGSASIKGFDVVCKCIDGLERNIELIIGGNISKCGSSLNISNFICRLKNIITKRNAKIKKLQHASNVKCIGIIKDPYRYIDECDLLISPFKNPHFSRPAIEAFAYGKPVIGSNIEGMSEIVDHEKNGLLVEKDEASKLTNSINFLCNHPAIAKEMGRNGREKAIRVFSPEPNMQKLLQIYEKVLKL